MVTARRAARIARRKARRAARRGTTTTTEIGATYLPPPVWTSPTPSPTPTPDNGGGGGGGSPGLTPEQMQFLQENPPLSPATPTEPGGLTPEQQQFLQENPQLPTPSRTGGRSRDRDTALAPDEDQPLIFLKADEAADRGITTTTVEGGEISEAQKRADESIRFADLLIGRESGTVAVPESQLQFERVVTKSGKTSSEVISDFSSFGAEVGSPSLVGVGPIGYRPRETVEFSAGLTEGFIPETKGELLLTAASFGIGSAVGVGLKGAGALITKVAPKALPFAEAGALAVGVGAGGLFAFGKGTEIVLAESSFQRGEIVGETGLEVAAFAGGLKVGGKVVTSGIDIIRTRKLTEIPAEDVIAPEFLEGQMFPKIKKGQTAGQLRAEFLDPIPEIGEVGKAPRGFTALPTEPLLEIPRGDSFVFGSFSAPRVSPGFLRIKGGEERINLASFKGVLSSGEPTVARTTFVDIGFAPGITAKTSRPLGFINKQAPPEQLKFFGGGFKEGKGKLIVDFGKPEAPKGTSFIPFLKTEKESVLTVGTIVEETGRGFFFKTEGRRVPIANLKALGELKPGETLKPGQQTLGEFLESSSRPSESSLITPDLGISSIISRSSQRSLSSSFLSSSSMIFPSSSFIPSSSRPSGIGYSRGGGGSSSSLSSSRSSSIISFPRSYLSSLSSPIIFPSSTTGKKKKLDIGFDNPFKDLVATRKFKRTPSLFSAKLFEEYGVTGKQLSTGLEQTGLFERAGVIKPIQVGSLLGKVKKTKGRKK